MTRERERLERLERERQERERERLEQLEREQVEWERERRMSNAGKESADAHARHAHLLQPRWAKAPAAVSGDTSHVRCLGISSTVCS